jgi:hypothetical protein
MSVEHTPQDDWVTDDELAQLEGEPLPERTELSLVRPYPPGVVILPVVPPEPM